MSLEEKLKRLVERQAELGAAMAGHGAAAGEGYVRLAKEYAELTPIVEVIEDLHKAQAEIADLDELISGDQDADLRALAADERTDLAKTLPAIEHRLKLLLVPRDEADARDAILETRAGTGGEEAALFAAELFRMYLRYAETRGWKFEVLQASETGLGGLKEATASIRGKDVFARLKFESGVHRVQRVPATEASGRIHTSAATVAVLPEAEEIDVRE